MKYGKAPHYDSNPAGDSISIGDERYGKGISTENGTILLYKMAGNSFRFRAMVGVDDAYDGAETGRFRVLEEDAFGGKVLFDSGKMTKGSKPKQIDIDVRGMDCIYLKFEGKEGAFGSWGNARLVGSWDSHPVVYEDAYVDSIIRQTELIPIKVTGPKDNRINIVIINRWEQRDENPYNSPEMRDEFVKDVENSLLASFTPGDSRAQTAYANYNQFYNLYALWWPSIPMWRDGVETDLIDAIRDRMFLPWKDEHHGWVTFLIMPNRDGGGGGAARNMQTRTGNALIVGNAIGKMLHEISHTCTSIGDEYAGMRYDTLANPAYTVTKNVDPETIKWRAWINEGTPVPTPYERKYIDQVGAFEGAQYHLLNYYRPSAQGCIMGAGVFDNTEEMCVVCEQRLSMRAYALVNPIENPIPEKNELRIDSTTTVLFKVSRVKPFPDTQEIKWILNGKTIAEGVDSLYLELEPDQGYELVYALRDTTSMIREDPPYSEYPYREKRWRINPQHPLPDDPYVFVWSNQGSPFGKGKRYEAEAAEFDGSEMNVIDFGGASEQQYLQVVTGKKGVSWEVEVDHPGLYAVKWSYATRTPKIESANIIVNGAKHGKPIEFLRTVPLFDGWNGREVNVELKKGKNTIELQSDELFSVNIDYLWVPEKPKTQDPRPKTQIRLKTEDLRLKTLNLVPYTLKPKVKSSKLLMWLDACDIAATEKIPYTGWIEKVSGKKGPDVLFKPGVLNGRGVAGYDIVWLSRIEEPVVGAQTIVLVYRESDMSFEGSSPFRELDSVIGRAKHGQTQLFSDAAIQNDKVGRVFLNGKEVDWRKTPISNNYCLLTIELKEAFDKELKYTQGYWEGDLAEMMIFDGTLSVKERQKLEKALMEKWGLRR